jgi:DNA-binding PadR family transcriptional regulator
METLRSPAFHILLALAERDLHGLGIAEWVEQTTGGAMQLGPGTLYRSLREMTEDGMIREVGAPDEDADPRRKYYAMTPQGRRRLAAEAARLERLVDVARHWKLLPERG